MITKGIRGATTVDSNTEIDIQNAVTELLTEMVNQNNIKIDRISHVIFTTTGDINAVFPAKIARINLGWEKTAMMCFNEADIKNAVKMCLRVLIVLNCDENFEPKFIYLKGASGLR